MAPEDRRIIEFKRGISIGIKVLIPEGGQFPPSSILGAILLWKKAQKKLLKNIISEIINIIILYFINFKDVLAWPPKNEASFFTSFHHKNAPTVGPQIIIASVSGELVFFDNSKIIIDAKKSNAKDINTGHGLSAGTKNGFPILIFLTIGICILMFLRFFFINGLR